MPLASSSASKPAARSALASLPPPVVTSCGSIPQRSRPARADRQRLRGRLDPVAAEEGLDEHVDVEPALPRRPGAGVDHRAAPSPRPCPASTPRASASIRQLPGDDVGSRAALDHADVGGRLRVEAPELHRRDRRRGGLDRAAPGLGPDPGVRLDPAELGDQLLVGRRGGDHLADRRRVIEDEAALGAERGVVERRRAAQPLLLGDGEDQLHADLRPAPRSARLPSPSARSPRPCCRRRGSCRRRCAGRRRPRRPGSARGGEPCRRGRRTR